MGIISTLYTLTRSKLGQKGNAPGKSAIATGEGADSDTVETEIYHSPGIFGLPPDGVRAAWVPIGGSKRYGIAIAVNNYKIEIDVGGQGGVAIYSTPADGSEVKSSIILQPDGKMVVTGDSVEINGDGKSFVTWSELNTALTTLCSTLTAHVHPSNGAPAPGLVGLACDISAAETTTVKTGG